MNPFFAWFKRNLSDPEVIFLGLFLVVASVLVLAMGNMLIPVLASLVIAYLLEGLVGKLEGLRLPRLLAVILVFSAFLLFVSLVLFVLLPLLSRQLTQLVSQLPWMVGEGQKLVMQLPEHYPNIITEEQVQELIAGLRREVFVFGQTLLSLSFASLTGLITLLIYLVLIPLLIFFFLKDKRLIIDWLVSFLPQDRAFASRVWRDVDRQLANYVRGKSVEIIIVWSASFITFSLFGLQYAMLLGVLVGLSVIIPYIGAVVVTFPVLIVAWFQWGWGSDFIWLTVAYLVIQGLDGNVLVPLLFSEVVNLHPVAIIVAILVFGGFWGFWGVFFAIPLATVVQATLIAWPGREPAAEGAAAG
jgi:putative permease